MNGPTENVGPPLTPRPARHEVVSLDKADAVIDALRLLAEVKSESVTTFIEISTK